MGETPTFSILIPTHERSEKLRALLKSIEEFAPTSLERVVVVDDSRSPPSYVDEFPGLPLRHLILPERAFISRAKNLGLQETLGSFVYFIDDDNRVTERSFRPLLRVVADDPKVGAVMPSVLYFEQPGYVWVYATPFRRDRWAFDLLGRDRPRDHRLENRRMPTDALPNASLVRVDALREIGGFDERLRVSSSADLCQRLQMAGWKTWAESSAFVLHDVEPPQAAAYWAAHGVDAERWYYEVRDWFLLQSRLHGSEFAFALRAGWHAGPVFSPALLGFLLRADADFPRLILQTIRGLVSGLRDRLDPYPSRSSLASASRAEM